MKTELKGVLEIDHTRGVIYFHISDGIEALRRGVTTPLRICNLPSPIPKIKERALDITHLVGCDWKGRTRFPTTTGGAGRDEIHLLRSTNGERYQYLECGADPDPGLNKSTPSIGQTTCPVCRLSAGCETGENGGGG